MPAQHGKTMNRLLSALAIERQKLKEMNGAEKRWYIWEYYRTHIFITLLVIIMAGALVDAWFINKPKSTYLHVAWMASFQTSDELSLMAHVFTDAITADKTKEEVLVSSFVITGHDLSFDYAVHQRFMALLTTGELHAFIVEAVDYVEDLADNGLIREMAPVMASLSEFNKDLHNKIEPLLLHIDFESPETGELIKGFYAVPLKGSALLEGMGIETDNLYLCKVIIEGMDFETAQLLQVLYE